MKTADENRTGSKLKAWLIVARLQFYPMSWIAYSLGALCAGNLYGVFYIKPYLAGYLCFFLLELLTVLLNDYFDYETDKLNQNGSLYSGGSRAIVEFYLSFSEVKVGIVSIFLILFLSMSLLIHVSPNVPALGIITLMLVGILLGVGYTVPPLKFCYRGFGELVVGLTHSPYILLAGFFLQTGKINSPVPWLLSVPLFFAILAAILLAALPDYGADIAVSKKTFAVIFGPEKATLTAMFCVLMATFSAGAVMLFNILPASAVVLMIVCIPHALILLKAIAKVRSQTLFDCRIDGVMQMALSYIIWFGFIPLLVLFMNLNK